MRKLNCRFLDKKERKKATTEMGNTKKEWEEKNDCMAYCKMKT
jgi:hypothetical protein